MSPKEKEALLFLLELQLPTGHEGIRTKAKEFIDELDLKPEATDHPDKEVPVPVPQAVPVPPVPAPPVPPVVVPVPEVPKV